MRPSGMGNAVLVLPRMFGKLLSVLARNYCMFSVSNDASVAIPVCVKPMECSEYSEPIQDAAFEVSFQAPSSVTGYLLVDVFLRVSQSSWKVERRYWCIHTLHFELCKSRTEVHFRHILSVVAYIGCNHPGISCEGVSGACHDEFMNSAPT